MNSLSHVVVIGAGSMGSGIAAHLANAQLRVTLLDISKDLAQQGIERQVKRNGFMNTDDASRITVGSIDEDMPLISDADWIIEAVVERADIKKDLYAKVSRHKRSDALLSSNTSTIPLATLTEDLNEEEKAHFAVTHFFNPPRVMRLVEFVPSTTAPGTLVEKFTRAIEDTLGKRVILCRDTPGFIANRVGNFWLAVAGLKAMERGLDIETADAVFGKPLGIPRTGVFGLLDYIGLQVLPPIWNSFGQALTPNDAFHRYNLPQHPAMEWLLDNGFTGRTGESGFYRGRAEALDYKALDYRPRRDVSDPAAAVRGAQEVIETDSVGGEYARDVLIELIAYCLEIGPDIADTVAQIDDAMKLGYSWTFGPFELADQIGLERVASLLEEKGHTVPALLRSAVRAGGFYPAPGSTLDTEGNTVQVPIREDEVTVRGLSAQSNVTTLVDDETVSVLLVDKVAVLTLNTPMCTLTSEALDAVINLAAQAKEGVFDAVVIANDNPRVFSAGIDLNLIAGIVHDRDDAALRDVIQRGARAMQVLAECPVRVVAAARGVALGGGAELLLACDAIVAHSELRVGFPERHVGILPAWNGTARMLARSIEATIDHPHQHAFDLIMKASPLPSAAEARKAGILRPSDEIVMSQDLVLGKALELARRLAKTEYHPRSTPALPLTSEDLARTYLEVDRPIADQRVARAVADIYSGEGTASFEKLIVREQENAARIVMEDENAARVIHMAQHRRPLKD